jgi:pilus assembly protein CpaE
VRGRDPQSGQASVELVALLPLIVALALGCWQAVVAAQAWGLAGHAARAAARALVVGSDPAQAARSALPEGWGRRVRVAAPREGGEVTVRVAIPVVVAGVRLADARATAGVAAGVSGGSAAGGRGTGAGAGP